MSSIEEIIKTIVKRAKGVIDINKAEEACKASGIAIDKTGNISISAKNADETLQSLIKNLVNEGGLIVKIMLHNLSTEKGLKIIEPR